MCVTKAKKSHERLLRCFKTVSYQRNIIIEIILVETAVRLFTEKYENVLILQAYKLS